MATDRAAAPASEPPLQGLSAYLRAEANVRDVFAPCPSFEVSIEQLRGWADAVDAVDALANRAASAPQAVRMLSSDEIDKLVREAVTAEDSARLLIKRAAYKVLEVNGIVPLAPQGGGAMSTDTPAAAPIPASDALYTQGERNGE